MNAPNKQEHDTPCINLFWAKLRDDFNGKEKGLIAIFDKGCIIKNDFWVEKTQTLPNEPRPTVSLEEFKLKKKFIYFWNEHNPESKKGVDNHDEKISRPSKNSEIWLVPWKNVIFVIIPHDLSIHA